MASPYRRDYSPTYITPFRRKVGTSLFAVTTALTSCRWWRKFVGGRWEKVFVFAPHIGVICTYWRAAPSTWYPHWERILDMEDWG